MDDTINPSNTMQQSPTLDGYDVVGLDNDENGCSCTAHPICGHWVNVGDILVCKWDVDVFRKDQAPEAVVKVFKVSLDDGLVACHVGYLPKRLLKRDSGKRFDGMVLEVIEDLRLSDSKLTRLRSHQNYGMVYCHDVSTHDSFIGKDPFKGEAFDFEKYKTNAQSDNAATDTEEEGNEVK